MKRALVELVDRRPIAGLKAASELVTWAKALVARARGARHSTIASEGGDDPARGLRR